MRITHPLRAGLFWLLATLVSNAASQTASPAFENTIAQRALACTGCHGPQGRAAPDGYYPRLAGKPAGYLYNQLLNFRDGQRRYGLMTHMVEPLSDAYLMQLAQHFASLDVPYLLPVPAQGSTDLLKKGEQLALRGDPARKLPACVQCHGAALTGVQPNVPGLLGLPRDYVNAQLGAWITGQRRAHAPDCMGQVARQLRSDEVSAVSAWLASQRVPANAKAVDKLPNPMPLDCGKPAIKTVAPPAPTEQVARGAYLARAGNCQHCHTPRGGAPYAGGRAIATPFGTAYSSNLTPDPVTGLGGWSAEDFWQALHHGTGKDGRSLVPAFPYTSYTQITRSDADALHAFLQSLPPTTRANTPHDLRWPFGTNLALSAYKAIYLSSGSYKNDSKQSAEWNRGAYLVRGLGHCAQCHSPRNAVGGIASPLALRGSVMPGQNGYAPSLLDPAQASVAHWPLQDIVALLQTGQAPGASVQGAMAQVVQHSTQHLSGADLQAMAVYLKALPGAASNALVKPASPPVQPTVAAASPAQTTQAATPGATLYKNHCAACHGTQGQGVPGAYPALAGNRAVTASNTHNLVQIVLYGGFAATTAANPRPFGMPPYLLDLTDAQIATVLSHIRSQWGNQAPPVTPLQVLKQRGS